MVDLSMFFSMLTRGFHPLNPCRSLRRWFPDDDQRRQQEQRRAQEVTAPAERQVTNGWGNHPNFGFFLSIKQNGDMCMYMYI